jgi:hypothetical protein
VPATTTPLPAVPTLGASSGAKSGSASGANDSLTAELVDRLNPFRKGSGK